MLIILSKSPRLQNPDSLIKIAGKISEKEKVAVMHIQDACILGTMNEYCEKLAQSKIDLYALKADCEARGLVRKVNRKVRLIDYKQWVKLVMNECNKTVSWAA